MFKKNDIRCITCQHEYHSSDVVLSAFLVCPNCGTTVPPVLIRHDGFVKMNWNELRILAIYARRWSSIFDKRLQGDIDAMHALNAILAKLGKYQPKDGQPLDEEKPQTLEKIPRVDHPQEEKPTPIPSPFFKMGKPPAQEI